MEKTLYVFAILSSILRSLVTKILIVSWVVYCLICLVWGIHACVWFMSRDFRGLPPEKQELFQAYRRLDIGQFSPVISVVGSLVLLPLRLLLSALLGILNLLLFSVVVKVLPRAYSRPGAKKPCRGYDSWTVRFLHFASAMINRSLLLIFGIVNINEHFTPETQRSERDIGHLTTVVANHVSVLDILYFMMRIFPAFVSKATVKTDPFFGPPAELLRCIFLDRSNPNDRLRALKDIKARQLALARQHSGEDVSPETIPPFLVFPEGTTTSGRHVAEFKQGAFVSLEAVTPVVLIYRCYHFNLSFETTPLSVWVPLALSNPFPSSLDAYWLPDSGPKVTIDQASGDPLSPEEQLPLFVDNVRREMSQVLSAHQTWGPLHSVHSKLLRLPDDWHGSLRLKQQLEKQLSQLSRQAVSNVDDAAKND